jgi:hypothetical protein
LEPFWPTTSHVLENTSEMIIRIASAVLTLAGVLALLSGLLFWLGWALQLMSLHMLLGIVAVAALWTIGFAQVSAPAGSWGLAFGALVTGILTLLLGLYQASLLVGPLHWIIQVVHLILGRAVQ